MEQSRAHAESADRPTGILPDLAFLRTAIVNLVFHGEPAGGATEWVLIDTGVPGFAHRITRAAEARYGVGSRPAAIVLTHGHFDHVGNVLELADQWNVPVYAHSLELPYLTGRSSYPPPDPTVGGGLMARLAGLYPRKPIDLGARVQALPEDGTVPSMPGWRWIHTPGHTAGHVSLFRESDRALIAGDAFVTTKQESALAVLTQRREIHGPPAYFTTDWPAARASVERLAALEPSLAVTGHGQSMRGEELREGLHRLAEEFDRLAVPDDGRYVRAPAITDERGVVSVPPPIPDPMPKVLAGVAVAAAAGLLVGKRRRRAGR